jgi:hypothetical protein
MSEENKKKNNLKGNPFQNKNPKKPNSNGFNFYWIYAIIIGIFIAIQLYDFQGGAKSISWSRFENQMLKNGDVEKIIIVNKEDAEINLSTKMQVKNLEE